MIGIEQAGRLASLWERAEQQLAARNPEAARAALEALVVLDPAHVMARLRLSTLATKQGRYRDSLAQLMAIVATRPDDPYLLVMLVGMLHRLGEAASAIQCLGQPAIHASMDRALVLEAAQLASQLEQPDLANELLDQVERLGGPDPASLYSRATLQLFDGKLDAAGKTLEDCLALAPRHAQAHWALSRVRRQGKESNHVHRLKLLLEQGPDPASAAYLGFGLFKELDDLGRTEEAWRALETACRAKRQQLDYRVEEERAAFEFLHTVRGPGGSVSPVPSGPTPIFIVGMPRTGTTLLERILGRHPDVEDAGELDDLPLQLRWCANRFSKSFLDAGVLAAAQSESPAVLGERYIGHAGWRARGKSFFTDKMPPNFLHVGLIARALPGARILHMTRHPMDTCFSNLKELFTEAYPYSYDQGELAAHYGRYRRLMSHWHEQFPGRVLDVSYEGLVADPVAASQRIFEHCGLQWLPECVEIETGGGRVTTASSVQVREPIHRRAVDGWRRYEVQLQPLKEQLMLDGWIEP
ncbi:MAG: sulfotransferase [Gammaproteobacteria bacterium]|nr:sulfotransferase [Gammaproteobacteria bacterium]